MIGFGLCHFDGQSPFFMPRDQGKFIIFSGFLWFFHRRGFYNRVK